MTSQDNNEREQQVTRPAISRRGLVGGAAGAAGAAAIGLAAGRAGATPASRRAPAVISRQDAVELEVWGFDEGRINFVNNAAQLASFKDKHPNVTVTVRQFPFAEMHDKLLAALISGRGAPDIAEVEIGRFSGFLKGDRVGFIPLGDRIGAEIDNLYKPAAVDPWTWQGQIYGLGNELNAVALTYRKDLTDSLGITTPFETWQQVIDAGQQISADGETKAFAVHDIAFGDWFQFAQMAGTGLFDAQGAFIGDGPLGVEAMQFARDLVYVHGIGAIAPADAQNDWTGPAYWAAFQAGKFTMLFGPPWHTGGLATNVPDQAGMWAIQKLPTGLGESRPTANFGGTGQCITEQCENPDIAWDLLATANLTVESHLFDFNARTVFPAYIPVYEAPELQATNAYFGGAQIAQLYSTLAPDLPPFNQSPYLSDTNAEMIRTVITPVMNDRAQVSEAMAELREKVEDLMSE